MNLSEAYKELDLPQTVTQEEAKKKYKSLMRKYHPDVNKEPGAETKFKKIGEAYSCIQAGKGNEQNHHPFYRQTQQAIRIEHISIETVISFKDSALGCKRDLKFTCDSKCQNCNGEGERILNNGCKECGGAGVKIQQQGHMIFQSQCYKCWGKKVTDPCKPCNQTGSVKLDRSINVQIPPGIHSDTVLRLAGIGNYVGLGIFGEQSSDVHLKIKVTPQDNLSLENQDVVFTLNITLIEALTGIKKTVPTINGEQEIEVPKKSRNKEEVRLPNLGVNKIGAQRVILDVSYPEQLDIDKLIEALSIEQRKED